MERVLQLVKEIGETPLECINRFRNEHPTYGEVTMSYAGRLDPLAEGLLVVLVGEENKKRELYLGLDKEYEFEVLFGISTDSYDVLGNISAVSSDKHLEGISVKDIEIHVKNMIGKREVEYPPFSSKPVDGKPLFWWARNGRLDEIELPKRDIEIYSLTVIAHTMITKQDLHTLVEEKIGRVKGDFRQDEILENWKQHLEHAPYNEFPVFTMQVRCSSGTYVRSIAHEMGQLIGTGALALSIKRTQVGNYTLS